MNQETVTTYQFLLTDGIQESDFFEISAKVDAFIKGQPGFRYRSLAKVDDKQWLDINYWSNPQSAEQANKAFGHNQDCIQFMSLIEQQSVKMQSAKLSSQAMADCTESI